jgi:hypothetical protein
MLQLPSVQRPSFLCKYSSVSTYSFSKSSSSFLSCGEMSHHSNYRLCKALAVRCEDVDPVLTFFPFGSRTLTSRINPLYAHPHGRRFVVFRLFTSQSMLGVIMIALTCCTTPHHVGVTTCWESQEFTQFIFCTYCLLRNFFASQHVTCIQTGRDGNYLSVAQC